MQVITFYENVMGLYSYVQKHFVTSHFTRVTYSEYYLRNAYHCGYVIVKHMKISLIDWEACRGDQIIGKTALHNPEVKSK